MTLIALLSLFVFGAAGLDLGVVRAEDGFVQAEAVLANTSAGPARVAFVSTSCSCVTVSWPDDPVPPGGTVNLGIVFNPRGLAGNVTRSITVWESGGKASATLDLTAYVEPGAASFAGTPVLCGALSASAPAVDFGYVPRRTAGSRILGLRNPGEKTVEIAASVCGSTHLKVVCPKSLGPGESADLVLLYDMCGEVGACRDTLILSGASCTSRIPVSALCIEQSPYKKGEGPAMWTTPSPVGGNNFKIGNSGSKPLRIIKIELEDGTTLRAPSLIRPGKKARISTRGVTPGASIRIFSDDPVRPCREIKTTNQTYDK